MGIRKIALKADVEIQRPEDGGEDEVYFAVKSRDGSALTGNQIIEAIAEAVILCWENCPLEPRNEEEYDA